MNRPFVDMLYMMNSYLCHWWMFFLQHKEEGVVSSVVSAVTPPHRHSATFRLTDRKCKTSLLTAVCGLQPFSFV